DTHLDHVEFFVDGTDRGAGTRAGGVWSLALDTTALSDGGHTWSATAIDAVGNATATAARSFTVDNTPPTVALTDPAAGAVLRHPGSLQATAVDINLDHVEFFLDGTDLGAGTLANGTWSFPINAAALADGAHAWSATAADGAGNTTTASRAFVVDRVA